MKSGWLNTRESAVSLLRIFALLLVLILLSRTGVSVFRIVDDGESWNHVVVVTDGGNGSWYHIVRVILEGITSAAYYGGAIFALSWIVSLIGRRDEVNAVSSWLGNRESVISLLKKLALLVVLLYLPIVVIKVYTAVDYGQSWDNIVRIMLNNITSAAYYGGIVFALSWIVSLIGRRDEADAGIGWPDVREKAVSLLKIFALLIVLLQLTVAVIEVAVNVDWDIYWGYSVRSILWILASGISQGCILFALAWLVSLIGKRKAEEVA